MFKNNNKNRAYKKSAHLKNLYFFPTLSEREKRIILENYETFNKKVQPVLKEEVKPLTQKRETRSVSNFQGELSILDAPNPRFRHIESAHHHFHNPRVQGLLEILKKSQRLEMSQDEKKLATFFVAENKEYGVYGGAVLLKKRVLNAHKSRESRYAFQGEYLWTCSLGLSLPNKDPFHMSGERIAFIRKFYKELYAILVAFGTEKKALFLWVILDPQESLLLDKFGDFPFILQIKPENTVDGLFHGLLTLKDDFARIRRCGTLLEGKDNPFSHSSLRSSSQDGEDIQ